MLDPEAYSKGFSMLEFRNHGPGDEIGSSARTLRQQRAETKPSGDLKGAEGRAAVSEERRCARREFGRMLGALQR
jgi:hypothetical protein